MSWCADFKFRVTQAFVVLLASNDGSMKAIRSIRILRPLRAIQRSRGMRTTVATPPTTHTTWTVLQHDGPDHHGV